ncbi:MAG: hypothetical protein WCT85_00800, partial [Parachlamydiales bacterium]
IHKSIDDCMDRMGNPIPIGKIVYDIYTILKWDESIQFNCKNFQGNITTINFDKKEIIKTKEKSRARLLLLEAEIDIDIQLASASNSQSKDEKYYDLFEHQEKQPKNLRKIVDKFSKEYDEDNADYEHTQSFLKEVEAIGYTFDYYLDNSPYGLRPIGVKLNQLEGLEDSD